MLMLHSSIKSDIMLLYNTHLSFDSVLLAEKKRAFTEEVMKN